jgi:hypothetical protein
MKIIFCLIMAFSSIYAQENIVFQYQHRHKNIHIQIKKNELKYNGILLNAKREDLLIVSNSIEEIFHLIHANRKSNEKNCSNLMVLINMKKKKTSFCTSKDNLPKKFDKQVNYLFLKTIQLPHK